MKTVRQQLQHISFKLSASQMRCHTHTCNKRERERGLLGEDTHSESLTHTHRGEDTTERTACQTTWHHGQHNKHTHTQTHKSSRNALKHPQLSVNARDNILLSQNMLQQTQTRRRTRGLRLASATELFTDGPRCRETL